MSKNLPNMLDATIAKLRDMVSVNSVVGDPIVTADGVTIIPISNVSVGFGGGGIGTVAVGVDAVFHRSAGIVGGNMHQGRRQVILEIKPGQGIFQHDAQFILRPCKPAHIAIPGGALFQVILRTHDDHGAGIHGIGPVILGLGV